MLQDTNVILDQSTMSLVPLPKGKLLGGTTIAPGTGGETKAKEAELYIMDIATKKVEWHQAIMPGVRNYSDMRVGPKGLIYGIADLRIFFVFDPKKRKIIHQQNLLTDFGITASEQSPRIFVVGEKGKIYILFRKGIARIEPKSYKITLLAESPVPIVAGGDYLGGRIYFVGGSHVYSYQLKPND